MNSKMKMKTIDILQINILKRVFFYDKCQIDWTLISFYII